MITLVAYERDPVSVLLDRGARQLLERAYAAPRGVWVMTRLADPSERHRAWARGVYGIDVDGGDNAPTASGVRQDARSRWGRAFARALWYQHRWYGQRAASGGVRAERRMRPNGTPLQIEWGRRMPAVGVVPAGRAVRVRVPRGGQTALRVVRAKRDRDRIYTDGGGAAGRYSVAEGRDW